MLGLGLCMSSSLVSLWCVGFLLRSLLLLWSMDTQSSIVAVWGLSSCCSWFMDLVAPQHVGSSQTRDRTHVSCIGRHILYHWATREAFEFIFKGRIIVNNVVFVSAVQHLESTIIIHLSPPFWASLPPPFIPLCRSSQSTKLSSLCLQQLPTSCLLHTL